MHAGDVLRCPHVTGMTILEVEREIYVDRIGQP